MTGTYWIHILKIIYADFLMAEGAKESGGMVLA